MTHAAHRDALAHLRRADPVIARLIDRIELVPPGPRTDGTHLGAIVRAIVFQQLSGKAAGAIHRRFEALYGGRAPTADELLATADETLRAVGLSRAKTVYLKDLAARAVAGSLPVEQLHELDDHAVLETLTSVKGVGRWTAQMFLLFRLGRPDVLPDLDLGVRKAIQLAYGLRRLPTPKEVLARGAAWSPFASVATWYLWRSLELDPPVPTRNPRGRPRPARRKRAGTPARTNAASRRTPSRKVR